MTAPEWHDDRACRDLPVEMFFPVATYGAGPGKQSPDYGPAQAVCARCPVRAECYAQAEHDGDIVDGRALHGVIAGVAPEPKKNGRPAAMHLPRRCALARCGEWFTQRAGAGGAQMYCCREHAAEGRRLSQRSYYDRSRTA